MMRRRAIIGRRVGAGVPATPPSSLVFDSTLNLVFDGNSLIYGQGGAQNIPRCIAMIAPIANATSVNFTPAPTIVSASFPTKYRSSKSILVTNCGINGQNWNQMTNGGYASAAFDATKTNVLVTWEWTNSLTTFKLGLSATIQAAKDYVTANRAAHPWAKIIVGTALPRMNSATDQSIVDADNALLDQMNAYLLANWRDMGFDAVFDVRKAGTYFDMQGDYSIAHFNAMASAADSYWATSASGDGSTHVHLNSSGYWYIATTFIVPVLQAA